jgi:hypothetical protein
VATNSWRAAAVVALGLVSCEGGDGPGAGGPTLVIPSPSSGSAPAPPSASPNGSPVAEFRVSPDPPRLAPEQAITFNGCGSSDPDGDPLAFTFDFGDGSGDADPGTPCRVEHRYTQTGPRTATACVSDAAHPPQCRSWAVEVTCSGARTSVVRPGGGATLTSRTQVFECTLYGCTADRVVFVSDDWVESPIAGRRPPYAVTVDMCALSRKHSGAVNWHCISVQPDGSTARSGTSLYTPAYSCD